MEQEQQFVAPYLSFKTFIEFLHGWEPEELPPRIDRSVMENKSGSVQSQMLSALTDFGFIDENFDVDPSWVKYLEADESTRRKILAELIRTHYPNQVGMASKRSTTQMLKESFEKDFGLSGQTVVKAIRFFLSAAEYAGVETSPNWKPPTTPRRRRKKQTEDGSTEETTTKRRRPEEYDNGDSGTRHKVELDSGGQVILDLNVNLFKLSPEDSNFVLDLVRRVQEYEDMGSESWEEPEDDPDF